MGFASWVGVGDAVGPTVGETVGLAVVGVGLVPGGELCEGVKLVPGAATHALSTNGTSSANTLAFTSVPRVGVASLRAGDQRSQLARVDNDFNGA